MARSRAVPNVRVGSRELGQPDLIGIDLEPAGQPGLKGAANRVGRTGQAVQRDRVAVVVEDQEGRLLHEQPRDVVEPEVGAAKEPAGSAQIEPVDRSALP